MSQIITRDQVTEGLARLITVWTDKPKVTGLLKSYLQSIQALEDSYEQFLKERSLDTAIGVQLDTLGVIVGEKRLGRSDDEFRIAIRLRIAINNSDGTEPVVTPLLIAMTGAESVTITEEFPAGVTFKMTGDNVDTSDETVEDINRVFAACVLLQITTSITGVDFRTVDVDSGAAADALGYDVTYAGVGAYVNTPFNYNVDPTAGGFWTDYVELTTVTIQLDTGIVGTWYAVFVNRNYVAINSLTTSVNTSATALAALINTVPEVSASATTDTITITGDRVTVAKISENYTAVPSWITDHGGVMVDSITKTETVLNTYTGVNVFNGLTVFIPVPGGEWFELFNFTDSGVKPNAVSVNTLNKDVWILDIVLDKVFKLTGGVGTPVDTGDYPATISGMSSNPSAIAVDESNGNVIVADFATSQIHRILNGAGTFTQYVTFPVTPRALAINPTNSDVWGAGGDTNIYLQSGGTGSFVSQGEVASGFLVADIAVNKVTSDVWVTDQANGNVLKSLGGTGPFIIKGNWNIATAPRGITINSFTGEVYVTSTYQDATDDGGVYKLRGEVWEEVTTYPGVEAVYLGINSTTNELWVPESGNFSGVEPRLYKQSAPDNMELIVKTISSIGAESLPFSVELLGYSEGSFGTVPDTNINGDTLLILQLQFSTGDEATGPSTLQLKIDNDTLISSYIKAVQVEGVGTFDVLEDFTTPTGEAFWVFSPSPDTIGTGDWVTSAARDVTIFGENEVILVVKAWTEVGNYSDRFVEKIAINSVTGDRWVGSGNGDSTIMLAAGTSTVWVDQGWTNGNVSGIAVYPTTGDVWAAAGGMFKRTGGVGDWVLTNGSGYTGGSHDKITIDVSNGDLYSYSNLSQELWKQGGGTTVWVKLSGGSPVGINFSGIAINSANSVLWATSDGDDAVYKNTSGGSGSWTSVGTYPDDSPLDLAVDPTTGDIWITNLSTPAQVYVLEGGTAPYVVKDFTGTNPFAIAFNSATDTAWVGAWESSSPGSIYQYAPT